MAISTKLIAYGVTALILTGAIGYATYRIRSHFNEFARLEQAEKDLTTERDAAVDANEAWVAEYDRREKTLREENARLGAALVREQRGAANTRRQLEDLQNEPGRDDAMPPVFERAFDIVRERRSGNSGKPAPGGAVPNPGPTPLVPATP